MAFVPPAPELTGISSRVKLRQRLRFTPWCLGCAARAIQEHI